MLEYGVRYSIFQPYYALWGNQSFFDQGAYNPATAPVVNRQTGTLTGGDDYDGVTIPGNRFPSAANGHVNPNILNGTYNSLFRGFNKGYSNTVYTDVQPRLGFTLQVAPETVVRAGGGRFVQRIGISDAIQLGGNAPFQPTASVTDGSVDNPGGTTQATYPLQLSSQAINFPNPNAWSWNFAVEQGVGPLGTLTVDYVGRKGLHLSQILDVNEPQPGATYANPNVAVDALRPYQGFASILQDTNSGSSLYNGLQVNLKRRLTRGFLFGVAYTWSRSMDTGSNLYYEAPNAYNLRPDYGPSDFDIRQVAVINYVWNIPYGGGSNRLVRSTLGNWQLSGLSQFQTGEPFSVSTGSDYAGVGPSSGGQQLWTTDGKVTLPHQFTKIPGVGNWFSPGVFVQPANGTFAGRGTRNSLYNPGFQSWNAALVKTFHIIPSHENQAVSFRAESFNFTNHPNWDNVSTDPTSGTFGEVNDKGNNYSSDRQYQFSLRYEF